MNFAELFRVTLPETALEVAALIVLFLDLVLARKLSLAARVAIATLVGIVGCVAALAFLPGAGSTGFSYDGSLLLASGGVAAVAQAGVLLLTILTLLLFVGSGFTRHAGEYVSIVLMAAAGGLLVSAAQDLLIIFVGLELLSLALYILTAFNKHEEKSAESALKYYLFGGMSAAFLLFGFSYLYGLTGSTNLAGIFAVLAHSPAVNTPLLVVAIVLVVTGLGFKVAAAPFHLWAPDAYEGAPAPAAAFIASVSKVASFTLLLNFGVAALPMAPSQIHTMAQLNSSMALMGFAVPWVTVILFIAGLSMLVGNLAALAQTSVRRLLAYSAIAHAGYILLGVARGGAESQVLYYVITYGLSTIGVFGAIAVVERATGSDNLDAFLGLYKRNGLLASVLLVLFLSLAGIPPLVGFWAKFNLFAAVLNMGAGVWPFALVALAVAMSAVSLYYYLQVLKRAWVMPAIDATPIKAHPVTMLTLVAITLAVIVSGCFPTVLQGWIALSIQ